MTSLLEIYKIPVSPVENFASKFQKLCLFSGLNTGAEEYFEMSKAVDRTGRAVHRVEKDVGDLKKDVGVLKKNVDDLNKGMGEMKETLSTILAYVTQISSTAQTRAAIPP